MFKFSDSISSLSFFSPWDLQPLETIYCTYPKVCLFVYTQVKQGGKVRNQHLSFSFHRRFTFASGDEKVISWLLCYSLTPLLTLEEEYLSDHCRFYSHPSAMPLERPLLEEAISKACRAEYWLLLVCLSVYVSERGTQSKMLFVSCSVYVSRFSGISIDHPAGNT